MTFTSRDHQLFRLLTTQLRVGSDDQLVRATGGGRTGSGCTGSGRAGSIRRRLNELAERGLLARCTIIVSRPPIERPLANVAWGTAAPEFGTIAWQLEQRWETAPASELAINWATARAARLFGGVGGRLRQPFQIAHDLLVSDVFLKRSQVKPSTRHCWLGEDAYRRQTAGTTPRKVPDAVLLDQSGDVERAIEIGGQYSARKLAQFHRHCQRCRWSYEIW